MIQATIQNFLPWNQNSQLATPSANAIIQGTFSSIVSSVNILYSGNKSSYISWILDSGATDHVTCHLQLLDNQIAMHSKLYLPEGSDSVSTQISNMKLPNGLML